METNFRGQVKVWGQWSSGEESRRAHNNLLHNYKLTESQSVTWSATTLYKTSGSLMTAFWRKKLNMSLGPGKKQTGWCIESYLMTRQNVSVYSVAWVWTVCGDLRLNSRETEQSGKKVTLCSHSLESYGRNTVYKETDIFITETQGRALICESPLFCTSREGGTWEKSHTWVTFAMATLGSSNYTAISVLSALRLSFYIQVSHADVKNLCAFFQVNIWLFNWIFAHLGPIRELRGHFL